ncbi:MAG: CAP domain-containing protein [Polyangiaceae bacterium]
MSPARAAAPLAALLVIVSACGSVGAGGASAGTFKESAVPAGWPTEILEAHNRHRAAHCAPPLAWSEELASVAQAWADKLATNGCKLQHSHGELGENLAGGTTGLVGASKSVELWYGESSQYDFAHGGFSMTTGHFTQLVWKDSARLGCGTASCGGTGVYVCEYDPPGNVEGLYAENVSAATCKSAADRR